MPEYYSNDKDCHELAKLLLNEMEGKIRFLGATYLETPIGLYKSPVRRDDRKYLFGDYPITFAYKYLDGVFLRMTVGTATESITDGERFAALSDFYQALFKKFGKPTVFYTVDHEKGFLNLQWSFIDKDSEIQKFRANTYFDDGKTEELVIFDGNDTEGFDETTGLPRELNDLIKKDSKNFMYYKNGSKEGTMLTKNKE